MFFEARQGCQAASVDRRGPSMQGRRQQALFGAEMIMGGGKINLGGFGDGAQRRGGIALFDEQVLGGLQDTGLGGDFRFWLGNWDDAAPY